VFTGSAELSKSLQQSLENLVSQDGFDGITAAVVLPDGRLWGGAAGFDDPSVSRPMTPDSRLMSASIGKTWVAALALALQQDKRLNLDNKISHWLGDEPWFDQLPNGPYITLRQLLNHSSGLPDHIFQDSYREQALRRRDELREYRFTPTEQISYILGLMPLFPAGEGLAYSDTAFILAGLILEQAGEADYYQQIQSRFLKPLALNLTEPSVQRHLPGLSQATWGNDYAPEGRKYAMLLPDGKMAFNPASEWTGGGLVTNSKDLARWYSALFSGEILSTESRRQMVESLAPETEDSRTRFGAGVRTGLGVFVNKTSHGIRYEHSGWYPGYCSSAAYFPDYRVSVAVQVNQDFEVNVQNYLMQLTDLVVSQLE